MTVYATTVALDASAAERRAERIRLRLDAIADNYSAVLPMIREAIDKRDDVALGYKSVGEYVADRFGGALNNLGIEVRREVVRELTSAGMSTRAIAPVVGVGNKTVHRDLLAAPVSHDTPDGIDPHTGEVPADYPEPEVTYTPPAKVTGLDGKDYTRPEPRRPQRRSLIDDARDAGQELRKAIERLERIAADDRLTRNKDEVAAHLRHHLAQALTVCQDLSANLNNDRSLA